jgi:hypothetical protein
MKDLIPKTLNSRTPSSLVLEIAPTNPGVYSIFLIEGIQLPHNIQAGKNGCIYIGKGEKGLKRRFSQEHLRTGNSGRSAFRRRLGAVLKEELDLKAIPRDNKYGRKYYKFTDEGEKALTDWISNNTLFGWCELGKGADFRIAEKVLADDLHPPLPDQPDWGNPFKEQISRLYKICQDEAAKAIP